jgi:hypothetical protein
MARTQKSQMRIALDAIAARIQRNSALTGIPVITYKQQDISSQVTAAVAKSSCCILVYPARMPKGNVERKGRTYGLIARVEVSSKVILTKDTDPLADEIIEDVISVLDGYDIDSSNTFRNLLVTGDAEPVADPSFLVWGVDVRVDRILIPEPSLTS